MYGIGVGVGILDQVNSTPVSRVQLGAGDDAVRNTLILMTRIISEGSKDYYVRRWGERIIQGVNRGEMDRLYSLFLFIAGNTQYQKDIDGVETLKTPRTTLLEIEQGEVPQLDCDCMTLLTLALAKSLGYKVAIRAISIHPDKVFRHVYGMCRVSGGDLESGKGTGGWVPMDLTKPENGFGWEYGQATRVVTIKV